MSKKIVTILGVDPGIADTGYGVIKKLNGRLEVIDYGCIKTKAQSPTQDRLVQIYKSLNQIIKKYRPDVVGVEKLFFAKNSKTALTVGQARGVIVLAVGQNKLELQEPTPLQVKLALTSYGQASKQQVKQMVKTILRLEVPPKSDDAADALAIAISCANVLTKM